MILDISDFFQNITASHNTFSLTPQKKINDIRPMNSFSLTWNFNQRIMQIKNTFSKQIDCQLKCIINILLMKAKYRFLGLFFSPFLSFSIFFSFKHFNVLGVWQRSSFFLINLICLCHDKINTGVLISFFLFYFPPSFKIYFCTECTLGKNYRSFPEWGNKK